MNFASTAPMQSIMIRNVEKSFYMKLLTIALGGHSQTQLFFAYPQGLIYSPDIMSIYRINYDSSVTKPLLKTKGTYYKNQILNINALNQFKSYADKKYAKVFDKRIKKSFDNMIRSGMLTPKQIQQIIFSQGLYKKPLNLIKSIMIGLRESKIKS